MTVPRTASSSERSSGTARRALAVHELVKRYGDGDGAVTALDGVSFEVAAGEVVGLLGPNGAGKTTCLKCLLGLVTPTAGTVEVAGVDVNARPRVAHRRVAAMLEGARNVYWRLTPRENLRFFTALAGGDPTARADRHAELLDRLDLTAKADTPVKELSRGQKGKVALACTLAREVDVAILDEPTLGLDVEASLELRRELRELVTETGTTVLLSSHDMDVIEALCDRVIVLQDGAVVADDSVAALKELFHTQAYRLTVAGRVSESARTALGAGLDATWQDLGERTRVTLTLGPDTDLYTVLGRFHDRDRRVTAVESVDPDLEDVFLELTGTGPDADRDDAAGTTAASRVTAATNGGPARAATNAAGGATDTDTDAGVDHDLDPDSDPDPDPDPARDTESDTETETGPDAPPTAGGDRS